MRARVFYAEFIKQGDLVFDIGANVGDRTNLFMNMGARVVAVEAQPLTYRALTKRFIDEGNVVCCNRAVSSTFGDVATIRWQTTNDTCGSASISESWIQKAKDKKIWGDWGEWNRSAQVETTTLEVMRKVFGQPAFVKIDTEGSEYEIIFGMSVPIKMLSFEFHPWDFEKLEKILMYLGDLYEFKISKDETFEFTTSEWLPAKIVIDTLAPFRDDKILYGDIYARLK